MKKLTWLMILPLMAGLSFTAACGENGDDTPDGGGSDGSTSCLDTAACDAECSDTLIAVSGVASVHPVSAAIEPTLTMNNVSMTLEDPVQVLAGRDGTLEKADCTSATVTLTANSGAETTANYAFADVDTSAIALGLVATFDDADIAGASYEKTTMGLAGGPQTADLTVATPAFAVATTTEAYFSTQIGQAPGYLRDAGWIFGMFVTAAGAPIDGVELVDGNGAPYTTGIHYLAVDGTTGAIVGTETDGNTSPAGIFLVEGAPLQEYGGNIAGMTCASQQAATAAGSVFVVMLVCQ
ncbi:MAG: hypothetical protein P1V51_01715 [Deltaproteobacteria bacterium]|nr:hypothetical protein [Deltaproteobacteria bacterium]